MSASNPAGQNLAPSSASKSNAKSNRLSKRIILYLDTSLLAKFPSAQPIRKASRSKPPAVPTPATPLPKEHEPSPPEPKPEPEVTPVPEPINAATLQDSAAGAAKRKGVPGPKPGATVKRPAPGMDENGLPKPRGKPGPKKRMRLDGEANAPTSGLPPPSHHKLGPKFHQGAINAGLRALDRTGRPCRKWRPTGFQVKSFTGVTWELPSWRTPKIKDSGFGGDVKSETTGSSDAKPGPASSGAQSEKSTSGADISTSVVAAEVATDSAGLVKASDTTLVA